MMKINLIQEPFGHLIVENFFSDEEYHDVWQEMQYISKRMRPPNETHAAMSDGLYRKRGVGVFLHDFLIDQADSSIFRATRKIFMAYHDAVAGDFYLSGMYRYWCNFDTILTQMYVNGDYYKPHWDSPVLTHITLMHKTPKQYTGGDFVFPQFNYIVPLENNQSILFPAFIMHEVTQVKTNSEEIEDGRFTISNFLKYVPPTK